MNPIRSWQRLNPQTRRSIRRTSGLAALIAGVATAAWLLWPDGRKAYGSTNDLLMGRNYAIQRIAGCEFVRTRGSDGSLGYIYDVPKGPHSDIDLRYSGQEHIHKENPRALMVVLDADNPDRCRTVSQPRNLPYRPD